MFCVETDEKTMRAVFHYFLIPILFAGMPAFIENASMFLATTAFYGMYAHTDLNVDEYLKATDVAFAQIASAIRHNEIDSKLKGKPSEIGFKRIA